MRKETIRTEMKYIAIFAIPHVCVIYFCLIMIFLNLASPFLSGFAVDSMGRVYVGENASIKIYEDCVRVGSIELEGKNYEFTVDQNDHVVVANTSEVIILDSSGKVLERKSEPSMDTFYEILNKRKSSVMVRDDQYKKVGALGWTRIVRNNFEVVYRLSPLSFVVKCLLFLCTVSMLVNGIWVVQHVKRFRYRKTRGVGDEKTD